MSDIFVMGFLLTETIAFLLFKAKTCRCCRNRALRGRPCRPTITPPLQTGGAPLAVFQQGFSISSLCALISLRIPVLSLLCSARSK
jgi:hypothetical protein